jgi:RNA polymerase sigma-32 factor
MSLARSKGVSNDDRRFIAATMSLPMLERDHESELARRWLRDRDEAALHELTASHARLAVRIASGFKGSGLPLTDLIQEGNVGLMQAAERFDPERGVRFSTYATWWIRAAIQNFLLHNSSMVRATTTPQRRRLFFGVRRMRARLESGFDGYLTEDAREHISKTLNTNVEEVTAMEVYLSRSDQSLNTTVGLDDGLELQDLIAADGPSPEEITVRERDGAVRAAWIKKALSSLSPRERQIISRRFLGERRITLAEIGESFGVSKERIRQIEGRALRKLRTALVELVDSPEEVFDF